MTSLQNRPANDATSRRGAAGRLAGLLEPFLGGELPVRLRAWDGSETGPLDAPVLVVRSRKALRRLLWNPGELGLAQAYVTGEIDVEGDLADGFKRAWSTVRDRDRDRELAMPKPSAGQLLGAAATFARLGAIGRRPAAPRTQAVLSGDLHSKGRDSDAISYHYDLSNDFYALILDRHMAYSSGYWTSAAPGYTVEDAQRDKLDLVCRKIGLQPGMRFLDVGCGWGSLSLYAAEHYGVQVVGATIAKEQKAFIDARIAERGLGDKVEIRLQDYREIADGPFDAVASIEMGEHVGQDNYPTYVGGLHRLVREQGRVLIQQMSRRDRPGGGDFIESFIAPDMYMRPLGHTIAMIEDSGLEVRDVESLREHYVKTVDAWYATFEANFEAAVAMVGEEMARVWRLYLVGGGLTFEEGRMGVDQILSVKKTGAGVSGMPPTRPWADSAHGSQ